MRGMSGASCEEEGPLNAEQPRLATLTLCLTTSTLATKSYSAIARDVGEVDTDGT